MKDVQAGRAVVVDNKVGFSHSTCTKAAIERASDAIIASNGETLERAVQVASRDDDVAIVLDGDSASFVGPR